MFRFSCLCGSLGSFVSLAEVSVATEFAAIILKVTTKDKKTARAGIFLQGEGGNLATNRMDVLRQLVERNPKDSFALYGLAMELANQEEYEKALEQFRTLCEVSPNYSYAYYQAGRVLVKLGRTAEARAWYEKGIEVTTRSGDQHARGEIEAALGEL